MQKVVGSSPISRSRSSIASRFCAGMSIGSPWAMSLMPPFDHNRPGAADAAVEPQRDLTRPLAIHVTVPEAGRGGRHVTISPGSISGVSP
jgi:hypothetical protein